MCPGFERDRGWVAYRRQPTSFRSFDPLCPGPKSGRSTKGAQAAPSLDVADSLLLR